MHYEFTGETRDYYGCTLHRIRALVDIPQANVKAGDLGGWIESEKNLTGNAWVGDDAIVYGSALVYDNAWVWGNAQVYGDVDWLLIGPAKSSGRFTTAHRDEKLGVRVNSGCFSGSADEFLAAIEKTHAENPQALAQYRAIHQLIVATFGDATTLAIANAAQDKDE